MINLINKIFGTSSSSSSSSSLSSSASASTSAASSDTDTTSDSIVGTWSSKANTVFTGPGFYDPVDELLIEPALPGISYSFTEDGYWEEAIYQVTSNPKNHSCAAAVLIFQHGTYTKDDNGTLTLTPFDIDGRQLLSQPCDDGGVSLYSRYNQTEVFKAYQVYVDGYHGRWRIDLIKSNGAYLQPLYLAFQPPQMLPTITMNPTASASATNSANKLVRREFGLDLSLSERIQRSLENRYKTNAIKKDSFNYTFWWWTSASLMGLGAALFVLT
ncbi:Reversal of tor2 lethality [Pichia californica]|uniref:Protein ROT1 n=1 Tax=Pichia californica TaxID=460514 RepID=A0A9P7BEN3_9ASCO|nr:Reversal of tor2 lethality [[Candida] californica]